MTARRLRAAIVQHFGALGGWIILPRGAVITLIHNDRILFLAPRGSRDTVGDEPLLEALRAAGWPACHVRSVKEAQDVAESVQHGTGLTAGII